MWVIYLKEELEVEEVVARVEMDARLGDGLHVSKYM